MGANASGIDFGADAVNLQGDDTGFGLNVGLMYQLDDNSRFGFNYRSETDITFDGDFSNELPVGGTGGAKLPGAVDLTLPAIAEFSGSHQLDDKLGLHYSVLWTGWSSFESLEAQVTLPTGDKFVAFEKQEQFDDSFRYSVGADYQYNGDLLLRAGVAFDESPVSQTHLSISIPDTDRFWFSFGGNYTIDQNSNVDLGVSIIRGKTQTFTEADDSGSQWGFESKGHAVLLGAQYNYKF